MLKKLLGVLALSSLLFSGAYADDILAIVSKGQLTSNSAGVKELSLEEKMQVKGGYELSRPVLFQNMKMGASSLTQIGVVIGLSEYELTNKVSCGFGYTSGCYTNSYTNKQGYNDYMSVANQNRGEFLAVTATKTTVVGAFGIPQVKFTTGAMVVGISNAGSVYRIRSATSTNRIASEVLRRVGNDLNRILVTNY